MIRFRVPASPEDLVAEGTGPVVAEGSYYTVEAHSLIVLVSEM